MKLFLMALITAVASSFGATSGLGGYNPSGSGLDQDLKSYYHARRLIGLHRSMAYHRGAIGGCSKTGGFGENAGIWSCPYLTNGSCCPNCGGSSYPGYEKGLSSNPFGKLAKLKKYGRGYRGHKDYESTQRKLYMHMKAAKMMMGYKGKSWGPSKWKNPAHPAHPAHQHHNAYIKLKLLKLMMLQVSENKSEG